MSDADFDILGIGNAIVDVLARSDEAFLSRHDMHKGGMALIDTDQAEAIYAAMPPGIESSGGSVANSCAVASALGAKVAFIGRVAEDTLGQAFRHDITRAGVHFPTAPSTGGLPTARCLILVTPDGQRTMNTYLGACVSLGPDDVDAALVGRAKVTYLEGYLFDPPEAQRAFHRAAEAAHAAGRQVALSLSDAFCVHRHRAAFLELIRNGVDILFANEAEITALYEVNTVEEALAKVAGDVTLAAVTLSEQGSTIVQGAERVRITPAPARVVDTTGAGDAYAAGFLAAYTRGRPLSVCGRLGSLAAAEVIGHFGARPQSDFSRMADAAEG